MEDSAMRISATPVAVQDIALYRDLYRSEMNCQIVHDSMHARAGWTEPYLLEVDGATAGYGSILIGGPWTGTRTVFEFYALPAFRGRVFDLISAFLAAARATAIKAQTNDKFLTVMLHLCARDIVSEKIVFEDKLTTARSIEGAKLVRRSVPDLDWALEVEGRIVATGGILYHYNRPYGDIYMEVAEPYRTRGFGAYLVQELKRTCYELGSVPCARCNPDNIASRKALQKAGFVPCANILSGML